MTKTGNWKLGLILSLITAVMWGFLPYALTPLLTTLDPITITFYRFSGGGLLLLIWLVAKKRIPKPRNLPTKSWFLLLFAIVCICGNYLFWLKGLALTSPATAQVVIQIAPMLLLLGSVVIYREPFGIKQSLGLILFIIGLGLFFNQRLGTLLEELSSYSLGILYVVIASVVWAAYALAQKSLLKDFQALELIFIIVTVASLIFLPFSQPADIFKLNTLQLSMLAFLSINTAVAYGCFTEAMHHWDTSRVSAVVAIVPIFTLSIGYFQYQFFPNFLDTEAINNLSILGAVNMDTGSALAALAKSSSKTDAAYIDYD